MPVEAEIVYRNSDQVAADFIARLQARIPDVWVEADGNVSILGAVLGDILSGVYLANQILRDNIFIQTANITELRRHGDEYGLPMKPGTLAEGAVRFSGNGGTVIPTGAVVEFDPGVGDPLYYVTVEDVTIPNPGIPDPPTLADGGAGGTLAAGTYEYAVTFLTDEGETTPSVASAPLTIAVNHLINLTNIDLGGGGTVGRRLYRRKDGGTWAHVTGADTTIDDNSTTAVVDNNLAGTTVDPPTESSAERVQADIQAESPGVEYNTAVGSINAVADVPDGVTDVVNTTATSGGTDPESIEAYRTRLLDYVRAPKTGSPLDMEAWALEVPGVVIATAFPNDDDGTPTNGHVTVRIAGADGSIPDSTVVDAVLALLESKDVANATIHVSTFTAVSTAVAVTITPESGFTVSDLTPSVQTAISNYINGVAVGGTVYRAGISAAAFAVTGVATVNVTTPATDQTSTATQKRTPGTITVT